MTATAVVLELPRRVATPRRVVTALARIEALRLVPKLRQLRTEVVQQRSNGAVRKRRLRWRSPRWPRRRKGVLGAPGAEAAGDDDSPHRAPAAEPAPHV